MAMVVEKNSGEWSRAILALLLAPVAKGQRTIVMALCPSCIHLIVHACVRPSVNSSFKKLLRRNYWLDFYKILQECSLGGPFSNSLK